MLSFPLAFWVHKVRKFFFTAILGLMSENKIRYLFTFLPFQIKLAILMNLINIRTNNITTTIVILVSTNNCLLIKLIKPTNAAENIQGLKSFMCPPNKRFDAHKSYNTPAITF